MNDPLGLYKASGFSDVEIKAQIKWDKAHTNEAGGVQYPDVEETVFRVTSRAEYEQWFRDVAMLKGRRQMRDAKFLARVDSSKVCPWLFTYRICGPGKGYVVVPWCPPRWSGERLRMRLQPWANPWEWARRGKHEVQCAWWRAKRDFKLSREKGDD